MSASSDVAMAFRLSLRTHVIPSLSSGGAFRAVSQTFVDSLVFRELLNRENQSFFTSADIPVMTNSSGELRLRTSLIQRTIPIYIFAVDSEYGPMLVDRVCEGGVLLFFFFSLLNTSLSPSIIKQRDYLIWSLLS